MSDTKASKFGMLKAFQQNEDTQIKDVKKVKHESALPLSPPASTEAEPEVHFTNYLSADIYRRLQIYVAARKALRLPGIKVTIKSILNQALDAYLEEQGY